MFSVEDVQLHRVRNGYFTIIRRLHCVGCDPESVSLKFKASGLRFKFRSGVAMTTTFFFFKQIITAVENAVRESNVDGFGVGIGLKRVHTAGTSGGILRSFSSMKWRVRRCSVQFILDILWATRSVWGYSGQVGVTTVRAHHFTRQMIPARSL